MYALGVSDHVMVAHSLADPFFGPAQRLHGATYAVEIELRVERLGAHGVVVDIGALRKIVRDALDTFDYRNLDDVAAFAGRPSTSDRVAEHVATLVARALLDLPSDARPPLPATLRALVRESPVAWASFERAL